MHHRFLGVSTTGIGALLLTVGALLVIADVIGPTGKPGLSIGGTARTPTARLLAACALVGALLVLAGSVVLLAVVGVTAAAVAAVLCTAALLVWLAMAFYLRRHLSLDGEEPPAWLWLLRNVWWRPDD